MISKIFCTAMLALAFTGATAQNLNLGLVAHYPLNGNVQDYSGNNNHGIVMNGVSFTSDAAGNPNSAAFFDGIDDWVRIDSSGTIAPAQEFSIAFRFKATAPHGQVLFSKSDYVGAPNNYQLQMGFNYPGLLPGDGLFMATMHSNSCFTNAFYASHYTTTNSAIVAEKWYCVAMVFSNGTKRIYVNGSLVTTQTVTGQMNNTTIDHCPGGSFRLGTWWADDPQYFGGAIDEVRLYNRELSAADVDSFCRMIPEGNVTSVNTVNAATTFAAGVVPNPSGSVAGLFIDTDRSGDMELQITDMSGRVVYQSLTSTVRGRDKIALPDGLAANVYLIRLKDGIGRQQTVKWLKQD